ncbi:MAG: hypothetical protein QOE77_3869 [Blastocatellia bacterium]|jgi:hypothetical protein|nr:hypothetical protein [Blastocatellia bacterium]
MKKRRKHYQQVAKMDYADYVKEREQLSKGEQASYDSYEKAILTLSASFLAFSVAFVGLFKVKGPTGADVVIVTASGLLTTAWIFFAVAVLLMLLNFVVNAMAFRKEIAIIGDALKNIKALNSKNVWSNLGYTLYLCSGLSLMFGIGFLIAFCFKNVPVS